MSKKHIIITTLVLLTGYATIASALINPGNTLDPVATNPTECPNGPSDPTRVVTLPGSGVKLNEVAQDFLAGSIQYVNSAGNQHADNQFTRDSSTHNTNIFRSLSNLIENRKQNPVEKSYTNYLLDQGVDKICKKVGEEASETIIAAKNDDKEELIGEISDLFYHVFVLMNNQGVTLDDIENKLKDRHKITGNKKDFHTKGDY